MVIQSEKAAVRQFGCSVAEAEKINGRPVDRTECRSPTGAYRKQRNNARMRRIPWELTLPEWWSVWEQSGKWPKRGVGKGRYCMGRVGDSGAYALGNVYVCESLQNLADYTVNREKMQATRELWKPSM